MVGLVDVGDDQLIILHGVYSMFQDADKNIVKMLKENGRLVHQGTTTHSYPFCWR